MQVYEFSLGQLELPNSDLGYTKVGTIISGDVVKLSPKQTDFNPL